VNLGGKILPSWQSTEVNIYGVLQGVSAIGFDLNSTEPDL